MKLLILTLAVAAVAQSAVVPEFHGTFGYLKDSIKVGERIRQQEEAYLSKNRIIGGVPAALGQYPYQAGLIIDILGVEGGRGVCGGSLVSSNRVISAAHCWSDGINQGWRVEVVLGTVTLFFGGTRLLSSTFVNHPDWQPSMIRNDVAVIYLPSSVSFSNTIAPVSLPTGTELQETYAGQFAIASGFGLTSQDGQISNNQFLSHVRLNVITNAVCRLSSPLILQDSNICTSGVGVVGACRGDSGGPLVVVRNNRSILVGITSYGNIRGCEASRPSIFARTTSFMSFFNQHI